MSIQNWEHFFKPEARSSGRTLFAQGKVSITSSSDTEVVVYIRVSSPFKVSFKTKSVSSATVLANCNCPAGKKHQLCKHIWAGLLAIEQKNPDFLESKSNLESDESIIAASVPSKPRAQSQAWKEKQTALKEKQKTVRKEQYQKQKQRLKDLKASKKNSPKEFPPGVEMALNYFSKNGFELRENLSHEQVSSARKKLSRIFHPDFGGSREEILELNEYSDVLFEFTDN